MLVAGVGSRVLRPHEIAEDVTARRSCLAPQIGRTSECVVCPAVLFTRWYRICAGSTHSHCHSKSCYMQLQRAKFKGIERGLSSSRLSNPYFSSRAIASVTIFQDMARLASSKAEAQFGSRPLPPRFVVPALIRSVRVRGHLEAHHQCDTCATPPAMHSLLMSFSWLATSTFLGCL